MNYELTEEVVCKQKSEIMDTERYQVHLDDEQCDIWDNDCTILTGFKLPKMLIGCHLMPTCSNISLCISEDIPEKRKKVSISLRSNLSLSSFVQSIQKFWNKNSNFSDNGFEIICYPFKVCVVKNFIENGKFLDKLRQDIYDLKFHLRTMDLYEFFQSRDLQYLSGDRITAIYDLLRKDVLNWVSSITGYNLSHISATISLYTNTDYLLVHDDQREDRMVAFILYLMDETGWQKNNGGCLQLLNKDSDGQPSDIVYDIAPSNNQFIFFPVTNESYHQVGEIVGMDKYRLSINGWFHIKKPPIFSAPSYKPSNKSLYSDNYFNAKTVDIELESWINDEYLEYKVIRSVQSYIEETSQVSLKQFLKDESFTEILTTLESIVWEKMGPPNRLLYETAQLENVPYVLEQFFNLFQSTAMFQLLHDYTDLDLDKAGASMKYELQKWTPGSYALLTDYDWKKRNELDLIMYFGCGKRGDIVGASTQYVATEDEVQQALVTIEPEDNSLNIVYRDSARFTKYFSLQSRCRYFYLFICSYVE
ncbi:prolyl 3-hydroxylase OGFOD1 isoform X2 [Sitophilus oryzae]|uniref:uS12 prolyl 3-hydroxylase n=1 Tax=Sitophilus oryzae TaxID=7048 RepID=A0A6J2YM98_SITOR|nr:prolyl 3-hydroxylase OGFOD1 isoform X2 [Sitophilus oryzae]